MLSDAQIQRIWMHQIAEFLMFGLGILFSLLGDVLLMGKRESLFLFGLIAFLFTHIAYITGFRQELRIINAWSLIVLALLVLQLCRAFCRIRDRALLARAFGITPARNTAAIAALAAESIVLTLALR